MGIVPNSPQQRRILQGPERAARDRQRDAVDLRQRSGNGLRHHRRVELRRLDDLFVQIEVGTEKALDGILDTEFGKRGGVGGRR